MSSDKLPSMAVEALAQGQQLKTELTTASRPASGSPVDKMEG